MSTITEDFVSFEIAKLLKEKGFYSEDCFAFYKENGKIGFLQTFGDIADYDSETCVISPTLQMAMKWLREVHNLHIWIGCNSKKYLPWYYEIHNIKTGMVAKIGGINCGSYETTCEEAIKYCLENLIK